MASCVHRNAANANKTLSTGDPTMAMNETQKTKAASPSHRDEKARRGDVPRAFAKTYYQDRRTTSSPSSTPSRRPTPTTADRTARFWKNTTSSSRDARPASKRAYSARWFKQRLNAGMDTDVWYRSGSTKRRRKRPTLVASGRFVVSAETATSQPNAPHWPTAGHGLTSNPASSQRGTQP